MHYIHPAKFRIFTLMMDRSKDRKRRTIFVSRLDLDHLRSGCLSIRMSIKWNVYQTECLLIGIPI